MDLLHRLTQAHGVPGREQDVRAVIESHVRRLGLFDEIRVDAIGSLIGVRRPRPAGGKSSARPTRVMVAAHMDQIGFLVSHVAKDGHLRLHPVGSFDPRTLFATRVLVHASSGEKLAGVMNPVGRPIHTASADELRRVPDLADVVVDLGLAPAIVRDQVRLGDMVVFDAPFTEAGDSFVAPALDNRIGCWALIRALEDLGPHDCEIHAVWTAQEELGSRGAGPASFSIDADIGIACDTTVCCDTPGIPDEQHVTIAGAGVSLQVADSSTLADMALLRDVEGVASERGIKVQRSLMLGGGQDGALIQRSRSGVRTIVFSCPVKYLHTAAEMVHRDDLASYRDLLAAYLSTL